MSRVGGIEGITRTASPSSLKRKRGASPAALPPRPSLTNSTPAAVDGGYTTHRSSTDESTGKNYRSPESDLTHTDSGDLLRGIGSASSLASAASSVFSQPSQAFAHTSKASSIAQSVTPFTAHSAFSPPARTSPARASSGPQSANMYTNGISSQSHLPTSTAASKPRPQMLPPAGKAKGYRVVWDPELDSKLSKEEKKRATIRRRDFGTETYEPDPPPDPRLAIPGYMSGNCRTKHAPSKAIMRIAPYSLPPYKIDRYSIGPGEATQVVASGFDPFLSESTLRLNFSTFGTVQMVQNQTDPDTGSFLGIALVKYRDGFRDGEPVTATDSAKRAEIEFNGARIGMHTVRVEVDREGRKFKRHVDNALRRAREEREKEQSKYEATLPPPPPMDIAPSETDSPAPPLNAPKGPSMKPSAKTAEPARGTAQTPASTSAAPAPPPNPKSAAAALVEEEPILSKIKRKPYIFIPHASVPVLGTTIPHLKKRLKSYDWREVRLDRTGYYVVFEDSKRGEDETERCYSECNKQALFTYTMEMECQKYGNPDYERSPSPERMMAEKQQRENFERLQREEEEDLEIEKKRRAENLDPVLGALEQLRIELKDKIMNDVKTRIAIPVFHDSLDPTKHVAMRRKLGLPDPLDKENNGPTLLFNKAGDSMSHSPRNRHGYPLSHSKPLRPHDPNQQRGRRGERDRGRGQENVFVDERRRQPTGRRENNRGLHFRLQQMFDEEEDSDDEHRTSLTRDTEDQESRPLSRASRTSTPFDSESADTPKQKRGKTVDWEEEEKETFDMLQKQLVGHLLNREPEDLALRELELVVNTLPRSSKFGTRCRTELYLRQRSRDDDDLFQVKSDAKRDFDAFMADVKAEEMISQGADVKAIKEKVKKKRKTKKQILEEQAELKAKSAKAKEASKPVDEETEAKIEEKEIELEAVEELDENDIAWTLTHDKPRRTVEDDGMYVLDIDGWQDAIKDDEDFTFAKQALADEAAADLGDVRLWAWRQKEIKALNTGTRGPVEVAAGIQGYYVPNSTGSARTEGYHKILNEEKSKYLPHRIKVQRAREERQAQAKANPAAAAEAAKLAAAEKLVSTATSRSNRVNNRRLVNDINLQKQALANNNTDADIAIRFNQLKKRKKLVKFDRSAIHGWGLYAEENIAVNDLIIEYVGEKVRQKVADMRELKYDRQGVGSSYLFRMMDDEIVDATKKGGIARFINHSCNPNCTAKIIKVEGTPRIVIYALKDIVKNDELTYDYKFEREYGATDRIPCLCGSANCKGFLN